jgi:FixJ family two-component response regulator
MGQIHPFPGDAYVFIVDDDKSVSDALTLLLRLEGFATQGLATGSRFWRGSG